MYNERNQNYYDLAGTGLPLNYFSGWTELLCHWAIYESKWFIKECLITGETIYTPEYTYRFMYVNIANVDSQGNTPALFRIINN